MTYLEASLNGAAVEWKPLGEVCQKKQRKLAGNIFQKRAYTALYFPQFPLPKQGMFGVHQCYTYATPTIHRRYTDYIR